MGFDAISNHYFFIYKKPLTTTQTVSRNEETETVSFYQKYYPCHNITTYVISDCAAEQAHHQIKYEIKKTVSKKKNITGSQKTFDPSQFGMFKAPLYLTLRLLNILC